MKLSPLDIRKQEFSKQLQGYDKDEVSSFLALVADEFETLSKELNEMKKQLEDRDTKLVEYREREQSLQEAMASAQKASKVQEAESAQQARHMLEKAQLESEKILFSARKKYERLQDDLQRLEGQRRSYILKMGHVLDGQLDLIEILEDENAESILEWAKQYPEESDQAAAAMIARLEHLETERRKFLHRIKRIHKGQLDLLKVLESVDLLPAESKNTPNGG
ncbi:DivIVA domain-containing protein [bacterium]|nr:DivIVA domain-containing protein [bacterium]